MSEKEKNVDDTLKIIRKILDQNKKDQNLFHRASKVDKRKPKSKIKESIAERTKLRRQKIYIIVKKKENIKNVLCSHYFNYSSPEIMFNRLRDTSDEKNKNMVDLINNKLTKLKYIVRNLPENDNRVEENKRIIDIVEKILELKREKHSGKGLKILTPDQMLSRLSITLAQLKAENNSEKLKNEIRQLLYSLYRSKKLKKQCYKSLINII